MGNGNAQTPSPLQVALSARQFELELFWKRALFFWGFIASAFVGFANSFPERPLVAVAVTCFGVFCSFCWARVNRGSKYWYEHWEKQVTQTKDTVVRDMFEKKGPPKNKGLWSAKRYSVSRTAIALSYFTFVLWLALLLWVFTFHFYIARNRWGLEEWAMVGLVAIVAVFMVLVIRIKPEDTEGGECT